jgi:metallo-beta-lactamase family protein
MRLHIFGAAQTVTGAMFLLEHEGRKLLLDCGMFRAGARKPIG